ncbi:MAG: hemerythrin domain-containing protein [Archangium sp.]|nr:hemerythrin domain-containing protein [Archangium sp.]
MTNRDVVELLLEAHVETRQVVALACALASRSATPCTRETAQHISDFVEWMLPLHCDDEERSIVPRLTGRNATVDSALTRMQRQHLALEAPLTRLRLICRMIARDVNRLHVLRFELSAAAEDAQRRLDEHQAFEEAAVFPALKKLLYVDELESISDEMRARRLTDAAA